MSQTTKTFLVIAFVGAVLVGFWVVARNEPKRPRATHPPATTPAQAPKPQEAPKFTSQWSEWEYEEITKGPLRTAPRPNQIVLRPAGDTKIGEHYPVSYRDAAKWVTDKTLYWSLARGVAVCGRVTKEPPTAHTTLFRDISKRPERCIYKTTASRSTATPDVATQMEIELTPHFDGTWTARWRYWTPAKSWLD